MSGQLWSVPASGGYLYSDQLSDILRIQVQPLTKFRQFADAKDGAQKGLNSGDLFTWNVISNIGTQGHKLSETSPMPESDFTIQQHSLTVEEFGNSVPYTGLLTSLSKQDVVDIIDQVLKHDARKSFDYEAWNQMNATPLRVTTSDNTLNQTDIALVEDGTPTVTNNSPLQTAHIKSISDLMKERNIPAYGSGDDYYCISHPTTYREFKNELEDIQQNTSEGFALIMYGEIGRYEGIRFIEQTHIPKGGAFDSTTYDALNGVADPWNNDESSWAFFFGGDTVTEAIVIPEEIRAKIPGDYGRSHGIAWYYLGGYSIVHDDATNARIVKWDSAA